MTKTKKRKFTVKLKKRDGQPAKTRGVGPTQPLASEPPETFADQIIRLVGADQDPEIEVKYRAICGQARPVDELHAGDERIMDEFAECVTTAFLASLEGERMEVGLQVHQLAPVPGHEAEICVPTIRKIGSFYQNAEADVIAAVRSCPIPGQGSTIPSLTRELVSIVYGSNAKAKLDRALWKSRRRRRSENVERLPTVWIPVEDRELLKAALKSVLAPSFTHRPVPDSFDNWGELPREQADPMLGGLLTLMLRSQLPLKRMVLGIGAGKPIITGAIASVEHTHKLACKAEPLIVHRDARLQFWFSELRRLRLDHISVPVVKLH